MRSLERPVKVRTILLGRLPAAAGKEVVAYAAPHRRPERRPWLRVIDVRPQDQRVAFTRDFHAFGVDLEFLWQADRLRIA
jgi:hypothetical protein